MESENRIWEVKERGKRERARVSGEGKGRTFFHLSFLPSFLFYLHKQFRGGRSGEKSLQYGIGLAWVIPSIPPSYSSVLFSFFFFYPQTFLPSLLLWEGKWRKKEDIETREREEESGRKEREEIDEWRVREKRDRKGRVQRGKDRQCMCVSTNFFFFIVLIACTVEPVESALKCGLYGSVWQFFVVIIRGLNTNKYQMFPYTTIMISLHILFAQLYILYISIYFPCLVNRTVQCQSV